MENPHANESYMIDMMNETINEIMEFLKQVQQQKSCSKPDSEPNENAQHTRHNDAEMFKGLTMLDDKLLPCFKLDLSQAMLEIKKNPKCVPFQIYLERWRYFNEKYKKRNRLIEKPKPVINDALLPSLMLTLPIAIHKIKNNPLCVPTELYLKRWNELRTIQNHNKMLKH